MYGLHDRDLGPELVAKGKGERQLLPTFGQHKANRLRSTNMEHAVSVLLRFAGARELFP